MLRAISTIGKIAAGILGAILLLAAALGLAGWAGSSIPRNPSAPDNRERPEQAQIAQSDLSITIMVETNGVHTGIVVPVNSPLKDWRQVFPSAYGRIAGESVTHLAIGWGERDVFLNVRRWGDLRAATVLRIATMGGPSVLRVAHYLRPAPSDTLRPITITGAQYLVLIERIEAELADLQIGESRMAMAGTEAGAVYFEAKGRYTLLTTCNSWTGDSLAAAGVKMGWWTPFSGGVMKWITPPN